jgi:hypothetical protein
LEISRLFHDQTQIGELKKNKQPANPPLITSQSFSRLLKNTRRQKEYAEALANAAGCPLSLESYGISHLTAVQAFYDKVNIFMQKKYNDHAYS